MNIDSAQWVNADKDTVKAVIDGSTMFVACDPDNRHYAEIQRQVAAGTLTIADAD
tara:strand:- start:300 stop:464 length:165 start_codon:yes stop_codon:yes gene_type:complete